MAKTTSHKSKNTVSHAKSADSPTFFNRENVKGILGLALVVFSIFLFYSLMSFFLTGSADQSILDNPQDSLALSEGADSQIQNATGLQGASLSRLLVDRFFGIPSILIAVFLVMCGMKLLGRKVRLWKWFLNCTLLMLYLSILLGHGFKALYLDPDISFFHWGGLHGLRVGDWIATQIGEAGYWLLMGFAAILFLIAFSKKTLPMIKRVFLLDFSHRSKKEKDAENADSGDESLKNGSSMKQEAETVDPDGGAVVLDLNPTNESLVEEPDDDINDKVSFEAFDPQVRSDAALDEADGDSPKSDAAEPEFAVEVADDNESVMVEQEPFDPKKDLEYYKLPPLDLLKEYTQNTPLVNMDEQTANKDRIIKTLQDFGIEISSIKATVGPTITLYEITPAPGVRISKIRNLEDDIALSLSALGIRIIAPIPGKGTIGIEVPNNTPQIVSGQSILGSKKFQECDYELPLAIGKTISNEVFMVDLCKMPHLLVAGATGQGKSVGLNAMIMSLLYKKHPAELKLVMVDPKKVEFSIYSVIEKHFLAELEDSEEPIITDDKRVTRTLTSLCQEMDSRYDLLKLANVRNLKEYNEKFRNRELNPNNGHRFLPYIVVIIDEFGDLIMTAGKEIELPIARIAQKARAVGMHMIIATQRPTTNIITGTIKANFPARIAFRVSSMIDSRTILDRPGANQLIGRGDMLFSLGNDPVRVQCAFIDTPEVVAVTEFISRQQGYVTPFYLPDPVEDSDSEGGENDVDMGKLDSLFEDAARLIVIHQLGSTSLIQRKFSIGYNRAGRLMDQLEKAGIVGPAQGSKPRDVYCIDETDLEGKLENLRK